MSPVDAGVVATSIGFVVSLLIAVWYAAPWMNRRALAVALSSRCGSTRSASSRSRSSPRSDTASGSRTASRRQIAWGDVAGGILALVALWLLRSGSRAAIAVIWLFVVETVADFVNASAISIREHTSETAHALTWLILNVYVPVLVVSLGLIVWQLLTRRGEDSRWGRPRLGCPPRQGDIMSIMGVRPASPGRARRSGSGSPRSSPTTAPRG